MSRGAEPAAPRPLPGFEGTPRYWDTSDGNWIAPVLPGEYYVTKSTEVISTVLGSCVSTCVRDAVVGISGLNHFMLPNQGSAYDAGHGLRYGCFAVERLFAELVKHGGRRERFEIKVFGGGKIIQGMSDIGRKNIDFVHQYLASQRLTIDAEDTGGTWARRVRYYTGTGRVLVQRLQTRETSEIAREERNLQRTLSIAPPLGERDSRD